VILGTRVLKALSAAGAVVVCGVSGLLVATDPKPVAAPLRPPVNGSAPATVALSIPPSCVGTAGALDPALLLVVRQLEAATDAFSRRSILASLSATQRLEVEAYVRSSRRSATGADAPCAPTGSGAAAKPSIAPSVVAAPASAQPLISTYVS
jgi:hypothetical protein